LHGNLEWDLRANHLLRDAVGLAWVGRFFQGEEPQRWLATATRIAAEQAREQVLADGGHFERSPHYHLEVMHDCRSLSLLVKAPQVVGLLNDSWGRMAEYIDWLRHPDGLSPQFNDGGSCRPNRRSVTGGRHFADSGVVAWHGEPWTVFFDVGEIGPDCQPGHAHADSLTLECSLHGRRLFIDPGCHSYDHDERRRYDRSTAAHNTVCIDDTDSSEVWHIFRVGRRARPRDVRVEITSDALWASATHDGYDHLPGSPRHLRRMRVANGGGLEIVDQVVGQGNHLVESGLLLAPEWRAEPIPGGWRVTADSLAATVRLNADREVALAIQSRPLHPDYGLEVPTQRLVWSYRGPLPIEVQIRIEPCTRNERESP
jgi:uncharacterized heparinase superfamily protein